MSKNWLEQKNNIMSEEKKDEVVSVEEAEKTAEQIAEEKKAETEGTEKKEEGKEEFEKENEVVPASKHNQTLRKLREIEVEKRELEKKLAAKETSKPEGDKPPKKETEKEEEEDDDPFKDDEENKDEAKEDKNSDAKKLIDEAVAPLLKRQQEADERDRKNSRAAFFEAHPEYLNNTDKWNGLLDEMDRSINPESGDPYITQLEKAHRIYSGEPEYVAEIEDKKAEIAGDATAGGSGAKKTPVTEEFTAEDKKAMKQFGISEEGMRSYKKKIESGEMQVLT